MPAPYRYRPEVLAALHEHGIVPRAETDPSAAYALLKSIYNFEIRGLNGRRREVERTFGPQPLAIYRQQVAELKARYPVLRLPPHHWVER